MFRSVSTDLCVIGLISALEREALGDDSWKKFKVAETPPRNDFAGPSQDFEIAAADTDPI